MPPVLWVTAKELFLVVFFSDVCNEIPDGVDHVFDESKELIEEFHNIPSEIFFGFHLTLCYHIISLFAIVFLTFNIKKWEIEQKSGVLPIKFAQLPVFLQLGEIPLTKNFIYAYRNGIR